MSFLSTATCGRANLLVSAVVFLFPSCNGCAWETTCKIVIGLSSLLLTVSNAVTVCSSR